MRSKSLSSLGSSRLNGVTGMRSTGAGVGVLGRLPNRCRIWAGLSLVQSTTNAVKVPTRVADRKNQVLMASPCGGWVVGLHWLGWGMRVVSHKTGYPKHTSFAGRGQSVGLIARGVSVYILTLLVRRTGRQAPARRGVV